MEIMGKEWLAKGFLPTTSGSRASLDGDAATP